MSRIVAVAALVVMLALAPRPLPAGIADSPLPDLLPGAKTVHLYSVPGVVNFASLSTYFFCTSTDTAAMQVGVEIFGPGGGAPANDAVANSLSVPPGGTVIFGPQSSTGISVSSPRTLRAHFQGLSSHPVYVQEARLHGVSGGPF